jgi:hypothetical protein
MHNDRLLLRSLQTPANAVRLPAKIPVTYKGVGRSSGDAPRAVKAILLNRLVGAVGADRISHLGGDTYCVDGRPITFRVTASPHRMALPWFNVSATEVEKWKEANTAIVVVGINPLKKRHHYTGIILVLSAEYFGNLAMLPTKASERQPSALFEIRSSKEGIVLANSSAGSDGTPTLIKNELTAKFDLSHAESRFLTGAYENLRERDHTSNGRFKPLTLLVKPGEASPEELAELLAEISKLYRMMGGSGITYKLTDVRHPAGVLA